jgi:phage repressor protein C with HTH and peptisase S24 domain
MRHDDIWRAIDTLAAEHGLSPSGLARKAGLDPTSFNLSKRRTGNGKSRWPSTESLAKVLQATGARLEDFTALVMGARALPEARQQRGRNKIPLVGLAQASRTGLFDDGGYPTGACWEQMELPAAGDANAYALSIAGDSTEPVFREGDIIVVSPAAPVRVGDRVVTRATDGTVMVKRLAQHTASRIELASLNPTHPGLRFATEEIYWMHRIIWAKQ